MNFQRYLFLFLRYSWLITLLTVATLGATWKWLTTQTPYYSSRGVIEVVADQEQVLGNIKGATETRVNSIDVLNTVVQSLTGNTFLLKVAKNIGLTGDVADNSAGGQVLPDQESSLAGRLRSQLNVSLRRGTRLIDVFAEDTSPEKARKLAAAVLEEFMASLKEGQKGANANAVASLIPEIDKQKAEVKTLEEKLATFRKDHPNFTFTNRENITTMAVEQRTKEYDDAKAKRIRVADDLEALKNIKEGDEDALSRIASVMSLPEVGPLINTVNAKETDFATLKQRYMELHPAYTAAQTELNELKRKKAIALSKAADSIRKDFEDFAKAETQAEKSLEDAKKENRELMEIIVPYNDLQKQVEGAREYFTALTNRLKDIKITENVDKNPFRINENPLINLLPVRPNKTKTFLMAGLGSLLLGIGIVLLIDRLDSSIRTVDEAESEFGLPVLAAVPEGSLKDIPQGGTVMTDAPDSPQAEAFRNLRASLALLGEESKRRIILVTSAIPAEGKTFTAMNLAASMASQGLRTLIIDADLRRPALSAAFIDESDRRTEGYRGLSDVLSGLVEVNDAIRSTSVHGLSLIPSGRRPPNPSELLAQYELSTLLELLLKDFDRILIDSAPVNAVSDSLTLATHAHAVCLVLAFGKTPRRAFQRALNVITKTGAKIAGIIMNRMPANRGAAYYYYYYGDSYTDGGETKKAKKKRRAAEAGAN
jgi:succinoglycan biosynthesis transport protein ExoP